MAYRIIHQCIYRFTEFGRWCTFSSYRGTLVITDTVHPAILKNVNVSRYVVNVIHLRSHLRSKIQESWSCFAASTFPSRTESHLITKWPVYAKHEKTMRVIWLISVSSYKLSRMLVSASAVACHMIQRLLYGVNDCDSALSPQSTLSVYIREGDPLASTPEDAEVITIYLRHIFVWSASGWYVSIM